MATDPRRAKAPSDDVVKILSDAADAAGIPRLLLVACCCAESGLDPFARRPANAADDQRYWPDVSPGLAQTAVRWSEEYLAWCDQTGHDPNVFPGPDVVSTIMKLYFDPEHAAKVAAANLHGKLKQAMGM